MSNYLAISLENLIWLTLGSIVATAIIKLIIDDPTYTIVYFARAIIYCCIIVFFTSIITVFDKTISLPFYAYQMIVIINGVVYLLVNFELDTLRDLRTDSPRLILLLHYIEAIILNSFLIMSFIEFAQYHAVK